MAQQLHVNTSSTSNEELKRIAKKAGFTVFHGAKHDKVKTADGKSVTLIPRHNKLGKILARKIVEAMILAGAKITFS